MMKFWGPYTFMILLAYTIVIGSLCLYAVNIHWQARQLKQQHQRKRQHMPHHAE